MLESEWMLWNTCIVAESVPSQLQNSNEFVCILPSRQVPTFGWIRWLLKQIIAFCCHVMCCWHRLYRIHDAVTVYLDTCTTETSLDWEFNAVRENISCWNTLQCSSLIIVCSVIRYQNHILHFFKNKCKDKLGENDRVDRSKHFMCLVPAPWYFTRVITTPLRST